MRLDATAYVFQTNAFGMGEFLGKTRSVGFDTVAVVGMRIESLFKEPLAFPGGYEILSENFSGKFVFQMHAVGLFDSGSGIEPRVEGVQKHADRRSESVQP